MDFLNMKSIAICVALVHTISLPVSIPHVNQFTSFSDTFTYEDDSKQQELTHETINSISQKFMDTLVQKTDEQYRVTNFQSKEELVQEFRDFASLSLAKEYVDLYYKERNNQLYIIPTETPPWLVKDHEYEISESQDGQATVTQVNSSELYGDYIIEMEFRFNEQNGWVLHKVYYN
ncbi:hypothetical protein [Salinibacillus xinjiangensis]|uniref:DUF3993 domain-containing protein n=1 Tax=Salinibacillus xinjiangensis TaxID=1229268 RepID=A0A6G1X2J1_9BACI|nr:hypothetical protein [Salinibacillus xinjiangensis]MRG85217.1 hypothetical protein [Salinibacillus xinjiangensis]